MDEEFDLNKEISLFKRVFDFLNDTLEKDAFKKYNSEKDRFEGPFLESSFEAILPGLAENFEKFKDLNNEEFREVLVPMYIKQEFIDATARGKKAISRIQDLTVFSYDYFQNYRK